MNKKQHNTREIKLYDTTNTCIDNCFHTSRNFNKYLTGNKLLKT